MRTSFVFSLRGSDWWKPFVPYWLLVLAAQVVTRLARPASAWAAAHPVLAILVPLVISLIVWIAAMLFSIVFFRIAVPKISLNGDSFGFRGRLGEYLASRTTFRGTDFQFMGRGMRLFVIILLGIWAPVIAIVVLVAVFSLAAESVATAGPGIAAPSAL